MDAHADCDKKIDISIAITKNRDYQNRDQKIEIGKKPICVKMTSGKMISGKVAIQNEDPRKSAASKRTDNSETGFE